MGKVPKSVVVFLFFKIKTIKSVTKSLDPDQTQGFVRPDLVLNDLQRLSAGNTSRQSQELEYLSCDMSFPTMWYFDKPVQPISKLRNSKLCSVSSLIFIEYSSI